MAASILRVTYCSTSRLPQFFFSVCHHRHFQEVPGFKEKVLKEEIKEEIEEDDISEIEIDNGLYPPIRGKYPPGDAENGTGWEGMSSDESWVWDRQKTRMLGRESVDKRIEFITSRPVKTWKFPTAQWGKNALEFMSDKTKTAILNNDFHYDLTQYKKCKVDRAVKVISPLILESLKLEQHMNRQKTKDKCIAILSEPRDGFYPSFENTRSHLIVKNLLNTILSTSQSGLYGKIPHLKKFAFDEDVTVAAQWSRDGVRRHPTFKPTKKHLPNNAFFHGQHNVDFQIRTERPLKEFYDRDYELCRKCSYSKVHYKPTALGYRAESMTRPIIPGYRLGTPYEFIHLSVVHTNEKSLEYAFKHFGKNEKFIEGYALSTGFLAAVSQAHMQGFNLLAELTYPFVTQTMVTDGETFYFSAYQLNTLEMWRTDEGNNRQNLCWISGPHRLYTKDKNGVIISINKDTLRKILKQVLLPTTTDMRDHELSPYVRMKPKKKVCLQIPKKVKKVVIQEEETIY